MTIIYSECGTGSDVYRMVAHTVPNCDHIQDGTVVCSVCKEIAGVEMEIEDLHSRLKALHEKHSLLRTKRNGLSDIISKLPYDIMSDIFLRCLAPREMRYDPLERRPCRSFSTPVLPLILGAVCHSWRRIVHTTPRLWSTISINFRKSNLEYISHRLQYSKPATLAIQLYHDTSDNTDDHVSPQVLDIMALVKCHLPRINILCLDLPCQFAEAFSPQDFEQLDSAPVLEELHFHCLTSNTSCTKAHNLTASIDPPKPRQVFAATSRALKNVQVDWRNIRHLFLCPASGGDAHSIILNTLSLLSEGKRLQVVDLAFQLIVLPGPLSGMTQMMTQMITQTSIRNLSLHREAVEIISHLTLPNLESLSLRETASITTTILVSFLQRSKCPLTSFYCHHLPRKQEFIDVFRLTPKLRWLFLDGGDDDGTRESVVHFLDRLDAAASRSESGPAIYRHDTPFLPLLQKFTYVGRLEYTPLGHFLDAIESRSHSTHRNQDVQSLRELEIYDTSWICIRMAFKLTPEDLQRILRLNAAGHKISVLNYDSIMIDSYSRVYFNGEC